MTRNTLIPPSPGEAEYETSLESSVTLAEAGEPLAMFLDWLAQATDKEPNDPNAMTLATVDADGMPDARMVLLKDVNGRGLTFFTNLKSAKGRQLASNPRAALVFHWKSLRRQVRVRGAIEPVSDAEADAYFATRARTAQIGAWASDQSRPMPDPLALERRVASAGLKFGLKAPPRPPHWGGFRLKPTAWEFWSDKPFRLHERLAFEAEGEGWRTSRLYP